MMKAWMTAAALLLGGQQEEVDRLVRQLSDAEKREAAEDGLVRIGAAALPALASALAASGTRDGARECIRRIVPVELEMLEELWRVGHEASLPSGDRAARLKKLGPPADRLERVLPVHEALELKDRLALLRYARSFYPGSRLPDPLKRRAMSPQARAAIVQIAGMILKTKDRDSCHEVLGFATDLRLTEVAADVRALIDDASINRQIVTRTVSALGDREAIPALLKLLKVDDWSARRAGCEALGELKAKEAVEDLLGLLDDVGYETNYIDAALTALGTIGDRKAIPPIRKFLDHKTDRAYMMRTAIRALVDLEDPEVGRDIVRALKEEPAEPFLLETLIESSMRCNLKEAGPEIRRIFAEVCAPAPEKQPSVAYQAIEALVRFNVRESGPDLIRAMKSCSQDGIHMSNDVCHHAAGALACLARKEDVAEYRAALDAFGKKALDAGWDGSHDHAYVAYQGLLCALATQQDRDSFARMVSWADLPKVRGTGFLPELLLRMGCFTQAGPVDRLRAKVPSRTLWEGSPSDVIAAISKELGMALKVENVKSPERLSVDLARWPTFAPDGLLLLRALMYALGAETAPLIGEAEIRIVPADDALRFWKEWGRTQGLLKD